MNPRHVAVAAMLMGICLAIGAVILMFTLGKLGAGFEVLMGSMGVGLLLAAVSLWPDEDDTRQVYGAATAQPRETQTPSSA